MNISVIGLGKLGLCTASCLAMKGHRVIGVDKNDYIISELLLKRCPIDETDLPQTLQRAWERLTITKNAAQAVQGTDLTLIITPTPSNDDGRFSNGYVKAVLEELAPFIKEKESFHVVNIVSTVMPGSCDKEFIPLLESLTGKQCGKDFGLIYNPEFIALGSVIKNFLNPDMVLIGASDERSASIVEEVYLSCCDNDPRICKMSLINAEITKISLNCYVTMKISYANELSSICERVPGADVDVITAAIGADSRVGSKYLKGGLGFGGPCFPRDNIAFQAFAEGFGATATLGKQVVAINHEVVNRIYQLIAKHIGDYGKAAILGLSYKPGTHIIEESQSVMLAQRLIDGGYSVSVHDPNAGGQVKERFGDSLYVAKDVFDCTQNADAIILMTDWPEYRSLDLERISAMAGNGAVFIDCWRIYKHRHIDMKYIGLGLGEGSV